MPSMLVVGSVAFDTLHIAGRTYPMILGGSATYASLSGAYFTEVRLAAVVGRDFPPGAEAMFRERRIDLSGLERRDDGDCFHWEGRYSDDLSSRTTLRTDLNVFAEYRPKIPAAYRSIPYVLLSNIDPVQQLAVLEQMDKPRLAAADTMNHWIAGKRADLCRLLERVDLLVINDEEARQLTGQNNLIKCARDLRRLGPNTVIIKKGEHGVLALAGDELFSYPALPIVDVADPTGAGDTFAGALLGYLARSDRIDAAALRKAVAHGSVLASYCVQGVGVVRLAAVTTPDIHSRFQQLRQLVDFPTDPDLTY